MKTKILLPILFFTFIYSSIFAQIGFSPVIDTTIAKTTLTVLAKLNRELTGDTATIVGGEPYTILSRHKNSPHNNKAAQFIYERFLSFGYAAEYWNFSTTGANVIATSTGTKYPNKQYIICGHFDDMPSTGNAPGADDNASGTCAVLEAARLLAPFSFDYSIKFIAFDEEEQGLVGSRRYADTAFAHGDSIMGVINLDMIAWDGNNDWAASLYSNSTSVVFTNYTKNAFNLYTPTIMPTVIVQNMSGSDHYYFWQRGYKALCGIENTSDFNPYYHTINDNFSHVVMPYFLNFTRGAIAALMTFAWDYFIDIIHTPIVSGNGNTPVIATAIIRSPHPIAAVTNGPRLYYKINSGPFSYVNAHYNNVDTFKFMIPDQPAGSTVSYYIAAQNAGENFVGTLPFGGKGVTPPGTIAPPTLFTYSVIVGSAANNEPVKFALEQNYPNPFNPATLISFTLAKHSMTKLVVYDIIGREVEVLINDKMPSGEHVARFDASSLSSGIYFYTLYIDGVKFDTKRMVLMK